MLKIQKHTFCVSTMIDADRALERVSFSNFLLSFCVDSCADFSQFQCPFCGVESRWKANCQR